MCMSTPKAPDVPTIAPPPPPVEAASANTEVANARSEEDRRTRLAKGRESTVLTSPLGDTEDVNVQKKALLGR